MKNHLSILIVEDDSNSAFVLEKILQKAGYDVLPIASDGETALDLTKKHHPALVLMDITLPGELDGIGTVQEIHRHYDVPVVYLTGHTSEQIIKRAKATVPYGFILKPYTAKMVLVTTEMAFHKAMVERESKEIKLRLAVTLGSLSNPIFSTTPEGLINYVNQAAQSFLDVPMGKLLNQSLDALLPLRSYEDPNWDVVPFLDFSLDKKPNVLDRHAIFLNKNGKVFHVYVQVTALKNLYGENQGYVVSLDDFSEQFYSEKKNKMLAAALKQLQEGVLVVERRKAAEDFRIVYINEGLLNCLKITDNNWLDKPLSIFFGLNFNINIIRALESRSTYSADTVMVCSDGEEKMTNWTLSPFVLTGQNIEYVVITVRDVTLLRRMEENLRQSQKIEAVGRLASGIAHDFNNLLSIINSCSDLALSQVHDDTKLIDYLNSILNAGKRGAMLVQQLMLFSRQGKIEKCALEVKSTDTKIDQTLHMLKHYLGSDISFETYIDPELWNVKIPMSYLDQILINLCVNGRDAMPQGGKMFMEFRNFEGQPPDLLEGKFVKVVVRDTGVGMDLETQKKIFEPFFTTKPVGKGTGLGLASVYGLVKHYEGSIQVESTLNVGTSFILYLPAQDAPSIPSVTLGDKEDDCKICQLDVEESIEKLLKPCLMREGWSVYSKEELSGIVPKMIISHETDADICVPKTFSKVGKIRHPWAISQILKEVHLLRPGDHDGFIFPSFDNN